MAFTDDQQEEIKAIVDSRLTERCLECSIGLSNEEHIASHRFLTELQKTIAFISEVKKGVLILIIGGFFVFIGGAILTGLAVALSSKLPKI